MEITMYQRLARLNEKIAKRTPGYYIAANVTGKFEWKLLAPDGKVVFTRDSFEAIETVALNMKA